MTMKKRTIVILSVFCLAAWVWADLPADARIYPAYPAERIQEAPAVRFGLNESEALSAEVKFAYSREALEIFVDVTDPTYSEPFHGDDLWKSDGIQIALDARPDECRNDYATECFELGLSVDLAGKVWTHCFYPGPYRWDWNSMMVTGRRNDKGYSLKVCIPWTNLDLDPTNPPKQIGANVLVNDRAATGRRYVEWTPGIGGTKTPKEYARIVFADGQASCLRTNQPIYDLEDVFDADYVEYVSRDAPAEEAHLRAIPASGSTQPLELATQSLQAVGAGNVRTVKFSLPSKSFKEAGEYQLAVEKQGQVVTQRPLKITDLGKLTSTRQAEAQQKLAALRAELEANPDWKRDSYLNLSLVIAERFLKRVEEVKSQPLVWSFLQMEEVVQVLTAAQERYQHRKQAGLAPMEVSVAVPGHVTIQDGQLVADGPRFPAGYGAFGQVVNDLPNFNALGVSLVQQERGINCLEADGSLNGMADSMLDVLARAQQSHVKVDLLLSTHYFPGWVREKDPEMSNIIQMGFIDYNIDHPEARKATREFLEKFLLRVKDAPALQSFCLSNEPRYGNSGRDPHSRPAWIAYLKERHKTIQALNALYETNYASFDDVPVPAPSIPKELCARRAYYDWGRFNQKHFADWHAWLSDIVRKQAPGHPTHAKVMVHTLWPDTFQFGIDPELMCAATDLAGCDNCGYLSYSAAPIVWYDLLHSFRGQPVFNSELHIITDNTGPIHFPTVQIRSALWRGVVHHLSAETMWVWEEPGNHDLAGNISLRPASVETAGKSMMDFQRLRWEIAALNHAKPRVAIVYSLSSVFWQEGYAEAVMALYDALNSLGQPVTFVSERQLAAGQTHDVEWIILPRATHVPSDAVEGLRAFLQKGGKILSVGEGNLAWDEYHRPRNLGEEFQAMRNISLDCISGDKLLAELTAVMTKDAPIPNWGACVDVKTGQPTRGVEYRIVPFEDKTLVFLFHLQDPPQNVKLPLTGDIVDLLTDEPVDPTNLPLSPGEPRLLLAPGQMK